MFAPYLSRCKDACGGCAPAAALLALALICSPTPHAKADTAKSPPSVSEEDAGAPIGWIEDATACAAPFSWIKSALTPFDRRPAWQRQRFADDEGTYTRRTQGDVEAGKTRGPTINLVEGQAAIFNDWVSFPYDSKSRRVLFYGGGHGGYAGGDIYLWDIASDSFDMVFEPRRLKFRGTHPDDPSIELWLPSDGAPAAPHTYGVALWHSSGKVLWQRGGSGYGYVDAAGAWQRFRNMDPVHASDLKVFDTTDLQPGRGDPARWTWGPDVKQVASAAPSAVELPDGKVAFIDEELRVAFYDVADNRLGPWQWTVRAGRVGAAHAVYSPYDANIYVRAGGDHPGVWKIDPETLVARRLAIPDQIPLRKPGFGNYRNVWFDRSGLVAAGSRLMVLGGYGTDERHDTARFGQIYFYDLANQEEITWISSTGPDLWSVHGKSWYLPGNNVVLSLPGADQPPWLMPLPDAPPGGEAKAGLTPTRSSGCKNSAR